MSYCTSYCYFQVYIRIILTTTTDKKLEFISEKFLQELLNNQAYLSLTYRQLEKNSSGLWYIWWPRFSNTLDISFVNIIN